MSALAQPTQLPATNSFEAYLSVVRRQPYLSAEEERSLVESVRDQGDRQAAYQLALSHLRYVVRIARQFRGYGLSEPDLVQEGNIGLLKAIQRFDPAKNVRLATFAAFYIRAEMQEYVIRNWRLVKIATTKTQRKLFFSLRQTRDALKQAHAAHDAKALSMVLDAPAAEIEEMTTRLYGGDVPLLVAGDADLDAQPASHLDLPDQAPTPDEAVMAAELAERETTFLHAALSSLPARTRHIVESRWLSTPPKTLQVLSDELGISMERVRQVEKSALKTLRTELAPLAA